MPNEIYTESTLNGKGTVSIKDLSKICRSKRNCEMCCPLANNCCFAKSRHVDSCSHRTRHIGFHTPQDRHAKLSAMTPTRLKTFGDSVCPICPSIWLLRTRWFADHATFSTLVVERHLKWSRLKCWVPGNRLTSSWKFIESLDRPWVIAIYRMKRDHVFPWPKQTNRTNLDFCVLRFAL